MSIDIKWFAIANKLSEGVFWGLGAATGMLSLILAFKLIDGPSSKDGEQGTAKARVVSDTTSGERFVLIGGKVYTLKMGTANKE